MQPQPALSRQRGLGSYLLFFLIFLPQKAGVLADVLPTPTPRFTAPARGRCGRRRDKTKQSKRPKSAAVNHLSILATLQLLIYHAGGEAGTHGSPLRYRVFWFVFLFLVFKKNIKCFLLGTAFKATPTPSAVLHLSGCFRFGVSSTGAGR